MYLEICLIIFSVAVLILAFFCVPILIQLWRTTKNVAVTLETLNQSLPTILTNLEEISQNIKSSTSAVNREVQNFSGTIDRFHLIVRDVVDDIQHITPVAMNSPLFQTVKNVVAVIKGIRVFLDVFLAKK
ncbi:MAG: hypothetical protein A4E71_00832 [Smithella sp. PtaU1.Bin162]|jgi:uncharacterized protein YoxC|nr:MAG: hypothetical protein A4E71_00832 [Smithella sp. PtaU1.Bin162]